MLYLSPIRQPPKSKPSCPICTSAYSKRVKGPRDHLSGPARFTVHVFRNLGPRGCPVIKQFLRRGQSLASWPARDLICAGIDFNIKLPLNCSSDGASARLRLPVAERNDPAGSRRYLHLRGEQPRWIRGESFLLRERRSLWRRPCPGNYFTINLCPPVMDYLIYYLLLLLSSLLLTTTNCYY